MLFPASHHAAWCPTAHKHVVAAGNPQKAHGFTRVVSEVIWPGDHLTVTCMYDASERRPIHDHELCNMHLMLYSSLPHVELCTDGSTVVDERAPGNMQRAARLLPDPFPLWRPVKPTENIGNGVSADRIPSKQAVVSRCTQHVTCMPGEVHPCCYEWCAHVVLPCIAHWKLVVPCMPGNLSRSDAHSMCRCQLTCLTMLCSCRPLLAV